MLDQLIDSLPIDLRVAIAATVDDHKLCCGCPEAEAAMNAKYSKIRVSDAVVAGWSEKIATWIEQQRLLQDEAEKVMGDLLQRFPMDGNNIPAWFVQEWSFHLRNPWSNRLEESIDGAKKWMTSR